MIGIFTLAYVIRVILAIIARIAVLTKIVFCFPGAGAQPRPADVDERPCARHRSHDRVRHGDQSSGGEPRFRSFLV